MSYGTGRARVWKAPSRPILVIGSCFNQRNLEVTGVTGINMSNRNKYE